MNTRSTTRVLAFVAWALLHGLSSDSVVCGQSFRGRIISRPEAMRYGMHRAWFAQMELDGTRSRLSNVLVDDGMVFAMTSGGIVQAMDAEKGQTVWVEQIGSAKHPSLGLDANALYVALVNGSRLYLLNRKNGRVVLERVVGSVPVKGPTLTSKRVYLPMMKGLVESFALPELASDGAAVDRKFSVNDAWRHLSSGRPSARVLVGKDNLCWTTRRGLIHVADVDSRRIRYRVETRNPIDSAPAYRHPFFLVATRGGDVSAVEESKGEVAWNYQVGEPVSEPLVVIGTDLFVCPEHRGILRIAVETGEPLWWSPHASRFVAASPTRVYGANRSGNLVILDAKSGRRIGTFATPGFPVPVANQQTDRVYLASTTGLIQCLRELALVEPVIHTPAEEEEESSEDAPESDSLDGDSLKDAPSDADSDEPVFDEEPPEDISELEADEVPEDALEVIEEEATDEAVLDDLSAEDEAETLDEFGDESDDEETGSFE